MQPFDGSKIKITCVRKEEWWGGNAVHFRYEGQTYRASIREDPDSEDESGNRVRYAHLQIADKNGNWGNDIAAKDFEDEIEVHFNNLTHLVYMRATKKYNYEQMLHYARSVPYKFYDCQAFANYLNITFVK